jgi:hypothetical protein
MCVRSPYVCVGVCIYMYMCLWSWIVRCWYACVYESMYLLLMGCKEDVNVCVCVYLGICMHISLVRSAV